MVGPDDGVWRWLLILTSSFERSASTATAKLVWRKHKRKFTVNLRTEDHGMMAFRDRHSCWKSNLTNSEICDVCKKSMTRTFESACACVFLKQFWYVGATRSRQITLICGFTSNRSCIDCVLPNVRDVSGFVRLFYILSKKRFLAFLGDIFLIF